MQGKDYHHAAVHYQAATRSPPILSFLVVFLPLKMRPLCILKLSGTNHPVMQRHITEDTSIDHCESVRTNIKYSDWCKCCDLQDDLNLTCKEIDADTEGNVASSWPDSELCDVKDGDSLLTCPLLAENKVSCLCVKVEGKVPFILNMGTERSWLVTFMPSVMLPWGHSA